MNQPACAAGAAPPRVWGWDLLRGLCALAVMGYHLLLWLELANGHTFGSYGVYLFFTLSGASLAYTYGDRIRSTRAAGAFLALRWWRLTPLFALVAVASVALFSLHSGQLVDRLPLRAALNLSYAFGLYDPVTWSLPIGGWSLGIEFVYYLLFAPIMLALRHTVARWGLLLAAAALQWAWIAATIGGPEGYAAQAVAYHQVPAFGAYFVAGCLIGRQVRVRPPDGAFSGAALAWLAMAGLLTALNPARAGDELLGWRGLVLPVACVLVVWLSGRARVPTRLQPLAGWLGDITYGSYLLHPVLFFSLTWFVLPQPLPDGAVRWLLAAAVALAACLAAVASERWVEAPLRRRARGWVQRWLGQ
ncbi:MAG: acyltransferase [Burkholderiaceae bacterium]|nr:acyltransferase [Burkholderiaceae bacterium]